MFTRLIRLTGLAVAGAGAIAGGLPAQTTAMHSGVAMHAVQHDQETANWRAGDVIVWIRVSAVGVVRVYASHGYRSAFAQGVVISADDAERFATVAEQLAATPAAGSVTFLGDSGVVLESVRQGDSAILTVRLGGARPDAITFTLNGAEARDVAPPLHATAHTSRDALASLAPPPAAPPVQVTAAAVPSPALAPSAPSAAPAPIPPSAPAPAVPSASPAPPTPIPPSALATAATPHAAPAPVPPAAPAPAAPAPAASAPAPVQPAAPTKPATPPPPAAVKPAAPVKPAAAPVAQPFPHASEASATRASLQRTSAGSIAKGAPRPVDMNDGSHLAPSTVANLIRQWQPQLNLCYSENGLRLNPALTGSISAAITVRPQGDVGTVTLVSHKWSGAGGTEAEACMKTKMKAWLFPPASQSSTHPLSMAFSP